MTADSYEQAARYDDQVRWMPRPVGAARVARDRRHESPGRTRRIAPTFTESEYVAIVLAARRSGLTPTGFCGTTTLAAATGDPPAAVDDAGREQLAAVQAELAELRTAVVRVGTNLNQAVTVLHATGQAPLWLRHVTHQCARVLAEIDAAASALHRRLP